MSEEGETNPWKAKLKRAGSPAVSPTPKSPTTTMPATPMSPAPITKRASTNLSVKNGEPGPANPVTPRSVVKDGGSFAGTLRENNQGGAPPQSPPISRHASTIGGVVPPHSPAFSIKKDPEVQSSRASNAGDAASQTGSTPADIQIEGASSMDDDAAEAPQPPPPLSLPERVAELEGLLAVRERELHASREQVNSLQRLQQNSTMDAKVRVLNEERAKLALKLKEMDTKLHKEIDKLKKDVKSKDSTIHDLKQKASKEHGARKSINEGEINKLSANAAAMEGQVREMGLKMQTLQRAMAEKEAENLALAKQLHKAQDAIVNGASVGYEQEVKLHQARSALHTIMSEVSVAASPTRERSSITPRAITTPSSPTAIQPSPTYTSPPRYAFSYSPRASQSPTAHPHQYQHQHQHLHGQ